MLAKPASPLTPYPRGWYMAAYSDEVAIGEIRTLQLFGRQVVAFRTEDGRAHVADAYCPHLGAHLGHGGTIRGECIRCPFHGWEFDGATGRCVGIANGDPIPPRARLRRWEVEESNGMILVWFHEAGEAPTWRVPALPELDEPGWSRWSTTSWVLSARIQDISENDADVSHSPVMHGFTEVPPEIAMDAEGPRCTWALQADIKLTALGIPRIPAIGPLRRLPQVIPSRIETLRWGLSIGWVRQWSRLPLGLEFATQTLAGTTPLDLDRVRLTLRHRVRRAPLGLTPLFLRSYANLFDSTALEDVRIWENKIYRMRPAASKSDWAILRFRRWARQFYDEAHWEAAMGSESVERGSQGVGGAVEVGVRGSREVAAQPGS